MPRRRKTLQEMAAEAKASPWACPRCHCMDWRTVDSYFSITDGTRHRRQVCRHCGYKRMTWESTTPPPKEGEKRLQVPTNRTSNGIALTVVGPDSLNGRHEYARNERGSRRTSGTGA